MDRGPLRRVAFALAVTAFTAGLPTPLYAIYQIRYGFTVPGLTEIFAAYAVGVLVTLFLVAPQADRLGHRPLLAAGLGLDSLAGLLFLGSNGAAVLALARVVSGMAVGCVTSTATAAMDALEPHGDSHHVARVAVGSNFGGLASGVALSGVAVAFGTEPLQLGFVVLLAAVAVGFVLLGSVPRTGVLPPEERRGWIQGIQVPAACRPSFLVAAGGLAACYAIYGLFGALVPSLVRQLIGGTSSATGAAVVAILFGLAAGTQLVLRRIRDRRALLFGLATLIVGLVLLVAAMLAASFALLFAATIALGLGIALAFMGATTLIDRTAPTDARTEVLAGYYLVGYLALAVPTLGVGFGSDQVGLTSAGTIFGIALGLAVAALAVATRGVVTPPGGEGHPS